MILTIGAGEFLSSPGSLEQKVFQCRSMSPEWIIWEHEPRKTKNKTNLLMLLFFGFFFFLPLSNVVSQFKYLLVISVAVFRINMHEQSLAGFEM